MNKDWHFAKFHIYIYHEHCNRQNVYDSYIQHNIDKCIASDQLAPLTFTYPIFTCDKFKKTVKFIFHTTGLSLLSPEQLFPNNKQAKPKLKS